jgi:hypothetical protein
LGSFLDAVCRTAYQKKKQGNVMTCESDAQEKSRGTCNLANAGSAQINGRP